MASDKMTSRMALVRSSKESDRHYMARTEGGVARMKNLLVLVGLGCLLFALMKWGSSTLTGLGFALIGLVLLCVTFYRNKHTARPNVRSSVADALARQHTQSVQQLRPLGNVDAVCPNCNQRLEKKPSRKKKCPHCGQFMLVRTRPSDRQQVLVTEAQAEEIEEQWSIINGTHDAYLAEKERRAKERAHLAIRLGREPTQAEVRWSLLQKELDQYARERNSGDFRNAKLEMADILRREGKSTEALSLYLEVCYLDLNDLDDTRSITDKELLRELLPWNLNDATTELAPAVIDEVLQLMEQTGISTDTLQDIFFQRASALRSLFRLRLSPTTAWRRIREALRSGEG